MEYNTERSKLIIPEYGRHIQKLIDQCVQEENAEKRNKIAQYIIAIMGYYNPHLRDVPDFQHKLWDQLFIMSNFQLEVDSPFPKPTPEKFLEKPRRLAYPPISNRFRYYGNHVVLMIKEAMMWPDDEKREALIYSIANHMKKSYLKWNKDTVDDQVIWKDLAEMSKQKLRIENPDKLVGLEPQPSSNKQQYSKHKKGQTTNPSNQKKYFKKKNTN